MKDIFLIISAIGVDYGVYTYQQRFQQLKETVASIKKYKPQAFIYLIETSDVPINVEDQHIISSLVDRCNFLHDHILIKEIVVRLDDKNDTNKAAKKTIGELVATIEFLMWLKQQHMEFDRVYKISGRLRLNDNFLLTDYNKLKGKLVTVKRWWYDRYAYIIQLWSFDFQMLESIFKVFADIWNFEMEILQNHARVDIIETTLYRYLIKHNIPVEELNHYLGVEGNFGQDGAEVYN